MPFQKSWLVMFGSLTYSTVSIVCVFHRAFRNVFSFFLRPIKATQYSKLALCACQIELERRWASGNGHNSSPSSSLASLNSSETALQLSTKESTRYAVIFMSVSTSRLFLRFDSSSETCDKIK